MLILLFLIKFYIVILLLRYFSTPQELNFNPLGKIIALVTNPLFKWSSQKKEQADRYTFPLILVFILFAVFMNMVGNGFTIKSFLEIYLNFTRFFMQLLIVSALLGAVVNIGYASYYFVFFYRLSMPFIKFTSFFVRVKSKWVILPTAIIIFGLYLILSSAVNMVVLYLQQAELTITNGGSFQGVELAIISKDYLAILILDIKLGLIALIDIIRFYSYIIIARALLSWVSPDPRTSLVQIIFALTEPILSAFRRVIPPIGVIDISAMIAVFVTYFISVGLYKIVTMI